MQFIIPTTYHMRGSRKLCQRGVELFLLGGGGGGGGEGFDEGRKDPNTTISGPSTGPPAKHHLNGVSLAGR